MGKRKKDCASSQSSPSVTTQGECPNDTSDNDTSDSDLDIDDAPPSREALLSALEADLGPEPSLEVMLSKLKANKARALELGTPGNLPFDTYPYVSYESKAITQGSCPGIDPAEALMFKMGELPELGAFSPKILGVIVDYYVTQQD